MSKGLEGRRKLNTEEPGKRLRSLEATREEYVDISKGSRGAIQTSAVGNVYLSIPDREKPTHKTH